MWHKQQDRCLLTCMVLFKCAKVSCHMTCHVTWHVGSVTWCDMLVLFDINQVEDQRVSSGLLYGSPRSVLITEVTHLAGPTSEKHGLKNPHRIVILFAKFGVILKSVSLETLLCAQMCSCLQLKKLLSFSYCKNWLL